MCKYKSKLFLERSKFKTFFLFQNFSPKNFKTITIKKRKEKKIQNKIFPNFQFLFQKCKKKHKKFFEFFNLFVKFFEKFKEQLFILQFMKPADFFVFCEKKKKEKIEFVFSKKIQTIKLATLILNQTFIFL